MGTAPVALSRFHAETRITGQHANLLPLGFHSNERITACRLLNRTWRGHEGINGEVCHESLSGSNP
jgi:hypothetical protein